MNILFDINHPAHVHLFRNAIKILTAQGHHITIVARDKEVTLKLLELYHLPYLLLSKCGHGILGLTAELIIRQVKLIPILLKNKINICISVTGASSIYACRLLCIPFIIFHDSESATLQNAITYPFASIIYTPESYRLSHGKKHIRYPGFHELSYLHPNRFQPNPAVLNELKLSRNQKYFILRFVAWKASHDVGQFGFNLEQKKKLISLLEPHGKVFITSEKALETELDPYRIKVSPDQFLDMLYYATMLITDSQTVTTEAALLGTPAIRYNSFVGPDDMGNFIELEKKYDLIYCFNEFQPVVDQIQHLLRKNNLKEEWQQKRQKILSEKIDVTEYMVSAILEGQHKYKRITPLPKTFEKSRATEISQT